MTQIMLVLIAGVLLLGGADAHSSQVRCEVTVGVREQFAVPQVVPTSNRLQLVTLVEAELEGYVPAILAGRIVTENCTPVAGARVVLWHRQTAEAPVFAGEVYTDNLGEFVMFSPLPKHVLQPQADFALNVQVTHYDHQRFASQLLLPDADTDISSYVAKGLTGKAQRLEGYAAPAFSYEITLPKRASETRQF